MILKSFKKIEYKNLNSKQKENYNFQKASTKLADYGYNCLRLSDDWNGADFIDLHIAEMIAKIFNAKKKDPI